MGNSNLNRILQEVRYLSPAERRALQVALETWTSSVKTTHKLEDELDLILAQQGVIRLPPSAEVRPTTGRTRELIEITGQPLSETIIEERR